MPRPIFDRGVWGVESRSLRNGKRDVREWAVDELRECFDFDIMIGEGARGDVSRESSDDTEVAEDDTEEAEHEEN